MARSLFADKRGGISVLSVFLIFALIGFSALAVEYGRGLLHQSEDQRVADLAAYSGAAVYASTGSKTSLSATASNVATLNGLAGAAATATVVASPSGDGNQAVKVVVATSDTLYLSRVISGTTSLPVSAVAYAEMGGGNGCVLALDKGSVIDATDTGTADLTLNSCDLYVNSSANDALQLKGTANITANAAFITGNYTIGGSATFNVTNINTGVDPAPDPYANVPIPTYANGCGNGPDQNNYKLTGNKSATIDAVGTTPYVFCNGIDLESGSTLTLGPGIYILDCGQLKVDGSSSLIATQGSTLVLTCSTGAANIATASIAGGATIDITAPTTGATAGLAIYQDRNAPSSGSDSLAGGSTQNITGAIYFPSQAITYTGGTSGAGASTCTQLIALKMTFKGNSNFASNCAGDGTKQVGVAIKLVD